MRLWGWLRNRKFLGHKFRRQHRIGRFILDFYCPELKLAIEADGKHHADNDLAGYQLARTFELKAQGIEILRIPNEVLAFDSMSASEWIRLAIEKRKS